MMRWVSLRIAFLIVCGLACRSFGQEKVNYQDNVLPVFRNICLNCHNPDKKKGGLDLSTYQAALAGSDGGPVLNPGDPEGSKLYRVLMHTEEPSMPPKRDKLPDKELNLIKLWIASGALETKNGKPIASNKPRLDLSVASSAMQKPTGPLPMPRDLVLEPFVRASRAWAVNCLASSPWAPVVAIGGQHQVLLYNPQTLELLGIVPFPEGEPCVTRFSRNGKMLMIGGGIAAKSGKVVLWDITAGKRVTEVGDEFDEVIAADISPDQTTVAIGGPSKVLKILSTQDGSVLHSIKKHTDWVTAIAYSPDGVLLASADRAGGLWVWESKTGREFYNLAGHKAGVTALAFRDDSNYLASASEDGTIKFWDMQGGTLVKSWNAHGGGVLSVAFTHDGRLVSCGRDRVVKLWKPDGSQIRQLDAFNDIALEATFDNEGKNVIAADWTGDIRVWNAESGKLSGHLSANPPTLTEQIALAQKSTSELQAAREKADADLVAGRKNADNASQRLQKTQSDIESAKKTIASATNHAKELSAALQSAQAAQQSAGATETDAQRKIEALRESQKQAVAARDKALHENESATQNNTPAADDIVALQNAVKVSQDAVLRQLIPLDAAHADATTRSAALEKLRADLRQAEESLAGAKTSQSSQEKTLPDLTKQSKAAQEQLVKLQGAESDAAGQLARATMTLARLKVGQFFLDVHAAREELAQKQAEQDQLAAAVAAAQADIDKTNGSIASLEKTVSDAPALIKVREDAIAKAEQAAQAAESAVGAAQAVVQQKQALIAAVDELSQRISTEAAKSTGSKPLADAAAKAKGVIDSLNADLENARGIVAQKTEAAKVANAAVATAQSALAKQKSDIEAAPAKIAALKETLAKAQTQLEAQRSAVSDATKATAVVKAKVDQLNAEYQKRIQEAGLDQPALVKAKS